MRDDKTSRHRNAEMSLIGHYVLLLIWFLVKKSHAGLHKGKKQVFFFLLFTVSCEQIRESTLFCHVSQALNDWKFFFFSKH